MKTLKIQKSLSSVLFALVAMIALQASVWAQCGGDGEAAKPAGDAAKTGCAMQSKEKAGCSMGAKAACASKGEEGKACCAKSADGKTCVCKSDGKACCAKGGDGKACASKGDGKACCAKSQDKGGACCKDADKAKGGAACAASADKNSSCTAQSANASAYRPGDTVADFSLEQAATGKNVKLSEAAGAKATVLIFWNQNCPFVKEAQDRVLEFAKANESKGVKVIAIDAGVNNSAESIKKYASEKSLNVLINSDSQIASQFGATRTPEVFLLDKDMKIVYHGAFDSGEIKSDEPRKNYAADAVAAILEGKKPETAETRAFGCSLKYAKGIEPLKPAVK